MRKILLFTLLTIFVSLSVADARITRGYNKFYDGATINSFDEHEKDFKSLMFAKILASGSHQYKIEIENESFYNMLFAEKNGNKVKWI